MSLSSAQCAPIVPKVHVTSHHLQTCKLPHPCLQLQKRAALCVFNRKDRLMTSDHEVLVVMRGALRLQLQASAFLAKPGRSRWGHLLCMYAAPDSSLKSGRHL